MPACNGIGAALFALLFCGTLAGAEDADQDDGNRHHFLVSWHDGQVKLTPVDADAPPAEGDYKISCSSLRIEQQNDQQLVTFVDAELESKGRIFAAKEMSVYSSVPGVKVQGPTSTRFKSEEAKRRYLDQLRAAHLSGTDAGMRESAKEHQARWMHVLTGETTQPIFHRFNAALAD